jgi:hypothetical protein
MMERWAIALALVMVSACASDSPKPMRPTDTVATTREGDTVQRTQTTTMQAKVVAVDQQTRMVTLEDADGEHVTFRADEQVKNLPQVRKGDMVTAVYKRAVAARLLKRGERKGPTGVAGELATAKPGEKPAAVGAQMVELTATVTKVDPAKQEVTLKGPEGNKVTVAVEDPTVIARVKTGDLVDVMYAEGVAISVDTPTR